MVISGRLKMGTHSLTLFPLTGEICVPSLGITVGPVTYGKSVTLPVSGPRLCSFYFTLGAVSCPVRSSTIHSTLLRLPCCVQAQASHMEIRSSHRSSGTRYVSEKPDMWETPAPANCNIWVWRIPNKARQHPHAHTTRNNNKFLFEATWKKVRW